MFFVLFFQGAHISLVIYKIINVTQRDVGKAVRKTENRYHPHLSPRTLTVDLQTVLPGVGDTGAPQVTVGSEGPRVHAGQVADLQGVAWAPQPPLT